MTDEQQNQIVEVCINEIKIKHNCRIGWACKQVLGSEQQNHVHQKMSALVLKIGKGRYERQPSSMFEHDYDIFENPTYRNELWHNFKVAAISGGFGLLSGLILLLLANRIDNQKQKQLFDAIDTANAKIDSLTNLPIFHQKSVDTTKH